MWPPARDGESFQMPSFKCERSRINTIPCNAGHNLRAGRARALRVPVRVRGGLETSKARDRPDRQVHALVMRRDTHRIICRHRVR